MLATKNRARASRGVVLAMAVLLTACSPPGPRALIKGKKLIDAEKYAEAAETLRTATSLMPTNAVAWNYLGLAYHRAGQGTNAAAAYTRALALNRELLEARFNLGCLWLEQNKLEAAKMEFMAYTMRRGNAPEGWLKLGLTHLRATNSLAAERSFREVLNLNPKSADAFNGLGLAQRQRGRSAEAAQSFLAALKQQSDHGPALLNLATVLQADLNDPAGALRRYREYLALEPRAADWEGVNALVQALSPPGPQSNVVPRVVASLETAKPAAAPVSRTNPLPKASITNALTRPPPAPVVTSASPPVSAEVLPIPTGQGGKTITQSSQASPRTQPVVAFTNSGNAATVPPVPKPERRSIFSRSRSLKPETNAVRDEPKPIADQGAAPSPVPTSTVRPVAPGRYAYQSPAMPQAGDRTSAEQALLAGQHSQNIGRLAEALQAYRRAAQLDGTYFEAHYRLGLAAFEARSFRLALSAWETALTLRPDSAEARYNFALTLKAFNYPQDAADELEKLLTLHPDEARAHLTLGNLCAEQLHDLPRARRHYGRVLQLDPRNPQAQAIRYWLVANPG